MKPALVFSLFESKILFKGMEKGHLTHRLFPDGECYLRFEDDLADREIVFIESLDHPNSKILPLFFAAKTAKELGARRVGLVAPYLPYMRQDIRFHPGEAITSRSFAQLISEAFDWMITVDPHLHRYKSLGEIYAIPTQIVPAAPLISKWIQDHVKQPVLIGPDRESKQWVSEIAKEVGAPYLVLEKTRFSDDNVKVSVPALETYPSHIPVLVDDIISTGQTMIETIVHLKSLGTKPPVCIGVHAIFAGITADTLIQAGAAKVITCNTVPHDSNGIDLSESICGTLKSTMLGNCDH